MKDLSNKEIKLGLIIGEGTGRELGDIFKKVINKISEFKNINIKIVECEHIFHTYASLKKFPLDIIERKIKDDIDTLYNFYKNFYIQGGRVVFRTAINAETLYKFRLVNKAIKIFDLPKILLIRDQMQGFYANQDYDISDFKITFNSFFSKEIFKELLTVAKQKADEAFRNNYEIWVVYKYHLFGNVIENWVKEFLPNAQIYQPNAATEKLISYLDMNKKDRNNLLIIAGNEAGDILQEFLIFYLKAGERKTLCSKNIYLHSDFHRLVEYQTVHGSADDIAKKNIVSPIATLRVIGEIGEKVIGIKDFYYLMEKAINNVKHLKASSEVVNEVLLSLFGKSSA